MNLTHLIFACDFVIFIVANAHSRLNGIKVALDTFYSWYGLRVSFENSELYISGVPDGNIKALTLAPGIKMDTVPIRYLGVHLIRGRLAVRDCLSLIEKFTSRIRSRGAKYLLLEDCNWCS